MWSLSEAHYHTETSEEHQEQVPVHIKSEVGNGSKATERVGPSGDRG